MIRGITVPRANVAPAICDPVQWSGNLQLAINNGSLLTVLDPVLPSLHLSIVSPQLSTIHNGSDSGSNKREKSQAVLDARVLFDVTGILHAEDISTWELRKFQNIEVSTYDEPFSFGKFADPSIVAHKWSPLLSQSKNAYLAVLLNTSELLILERTASATTAYSIKYNVFDQLVSELNLEDTNEIKVTKDQYLSLKVVSFDITKINRSGSSLMILSLGLADGSVSVYAMLDTGLQKLGNIPFDPNSPVIKMEWSDSITEPGLDGTFLHSAFVAVVTSSFEVLSRRIYFFDDYIHYNDKATVQGRSRYMVSQLHWHGDHIIVADTRKITVNSAHADGFYTQTYELSNNSLVTGLIMSRRSANILDIQVAHESGQFDHVRFDILLPYVSPYQLVEKSSLSPLKRFVSQSLYKFQLSNSNAVGNEDNTNHPYLNDTVEGKFINFGTKLHDGVIAIVSRVVPKRALNYTILSKADFHVDFIPLHTLYPPETKFKEHIEPGTAVGWFIPFWIKTFQEIPQIPVTQLDQPELIKSYLDKLDAFKSQYFSSGIPNFALGYDFYQGLMINFSNNEDVFQLQLRYNFNNILLNTFNLISNNELINDAIKSINIENSEIEQTIFNQIGKIVLSAQSSEFELDNFMRLSYYVLSTFPEKESYFESDQISNESEVTINTQFLSESFRVDTNAPITRNLVKSFTEHEWSRCKLTLLPLIQLNNKTSETGSFNYVLDEYYSDSWLVKELLVNLNYCAYSGNRTFKKKK